MGNKRDNFVTALKKATSYLFLLPRKGQGETKFRNALTGVPLVGCTAGGCYYVDIERKNRKEKHTFVARNVSGTVPPTSTVVTMCDSPEAARLQALEYVSSQAVQNRGNS